MRVSNHLLFKLCVVLCILVNNSLFGQNELNYNDRVWLKDGSSLFGELVDMNQDGIVLKLRSGKTLLIEQKEVKRVAQYGSDPFWNEKGNLFFQASGKKHSFSLDIGLGFGERLDLFSFDYTTSVGYRYRLSPKHHMGCRLSMLLARNSFFDIIALNTFYADYTYLIGRPRFLNPYISARIGGGSTFSHDKKFAAIIHNGIRPGGELAFGFILSVGYQSAFYSEFAFNRQGNSYLYRFSEDIEPRFSKREETVSRFCMRIGYLF
jgi:hypothetical protein